ncbi:MAG TPA: hypothetical protein VF710_04205 [Longimicrobium sp.]
MRSKLHLGMRRQFRATKVFMSVLLSCLVLGVAGCIDAPTGSRAEPQIVDPAPLRRVSISFDTVLSDEAVTDFLEDHDLSAVALYMYAAGLYGTDYIGVEESRPAALVRNARVHASEDANNALLSTGKRLATLLNVAPAGTFSDERGLVLGAEQHRELAETARAGEPLIWGVEIWAPAERVVAAVSDPRVKRHSDILQIGEQRAAQRLEPPQHFGDQATRAAETWPAAAVRARARVLAEQGSISALPPPQAVAAPPEGSYFPNSGYIWFNGDKYFDSRFRWDNPAFSPTNVRGIGIEIDLAISTTGGTAFVVPNLAPVYAPCTTWTDLPARYDDCGTAGIRDDPGWQTYSFGSYNARAIQKGKQYFGSWTFRGPHLQKTWTIKARGQETYNKACTWRWEGNSPWCMYVYNGRSRDLVTGSITKSKESIFFW